VQPEGCPTYALKLWGVRSVNQVLVQHLTRPEEEPKEEDEVAEHKTKFLVALKGLEAARKYIYQFGAKKSIIVMCSKVENELYRLRA
jgi:hypothetical protein